METNKIRLDSFFSSLIFNNIENFATFVSLCDLLSYYFISMAEVQDPDAFSLFIAPSIPCNSIPFEDKHMSSPLHFIHTSGALLTGHISSNFSYAFLCALSRVMALILLSFFIVFLLPPTNAQGDPPSPGYYPSSRVASLGFNQGFRTLWGPQNQRIEQGSLTVWLDRSSGMIIRSYTTQIIMSHLHFPSQLHLFWLLSQW